MPNPNALEDLVAAMTVGELAEKSGTSVAAIAVFALGSSSNAARETTSRHSPARPAASVSKRSARGGEVNTRTASGRQAYEVAVLDIVKSASGEVSALDVRAKAGGTPEQARTALNRLIEAGKIKYKGQARATRYYA